MDEMFDEESEQFEEDLIDDDEGQDDDIDEWDDEDDLDANDVDTSANPDDEFVMCEACGGLGELFGPLGGHRQMCGFCSGSGLQLRE
jgi:hypothetical protein